MINRIKHIILPLSVLVALAGCNQNANEKETIHSNMPKDIKTNDKDLSKGFQLLEVSCLFQKESY